MSGAAAQASSKTIGAVFCDAAPVPRTQVTNVVHDRVTRVDIVLAYIAAFALVLVQLRSGMSDTLVRHLSRSRGAFDAMDENFHLGSKPDSRSISLSKKGRVVLISLFTLLVSIAETIPVRLVFDIERKASNWVGIAARSCSSSVGWDLGDLPQARTSGYLLIGGYATSTMIKTTIYAHSSHVAKQLLIGAILVTVLTTSTAIVEMRTAWKLLKYV